MVASPKHSHTAHCLVGNPKSISFHLYLAFLNPHSQGICPSSQPLACFRFWPQFPPKVTTEGSGWPSCVSQLVKAWNLMNPGEYFFYVGISGSLKKDDQISDFKLVKFESYKLVMTQVVSHKLPQRWCDSGREWGFIISKDLFWLSILAEMVQHLPPRNLT